MASTIWSNPSVIRLAVGRVQIGSIEHGVNRQVEFLTRVAKAPMA